MADPTPSPNNPAPHAPTTPDGDSAGRPRKSPAPLAAPPKPSDPAPPAAAAAATAATAPATATTAHSPEELEEGEHDPSSSDAGPSEDGEPPLPPGSPPEESPEDGWLPVWDDAYQAYYFYNSLTGETTWTNPRVPEEPNNSIPPRAPGTEEPDGSFSDDDNDGEDGADQNGSSSVAAPAYNPLRYNPAIHGDYDPTAPYAQQPEVSEEQQYSSIAAFNRFTGKFQPSSSTKVPENYNDENKSKRQMEFYFDVDAAANSHDGRSLKAERQTKKLSKQELKEYKEKRKQRKEEKRRAWLKD